MAVAAVVFVVQSTLLSHQKSGAEIEVASTTQTPPNDSVSASAPVATLAQPDQAAPVASVVHKQKRNKRGTPRIGGKFLLQDHKGQKRSHLDFRGRYTLVYFGYSFCPDICPTALYNMTEALETLGDKAKNFQPLFITVDPERDTVEELAKYMENFHPSFIALTGSNDAIQKAKKAYHVYAAKAEPDGESSDYLLDHSSIIYVMDPKGRYVTSFNHATPSKTIVDGLLTLF